MNEINGKLSEIIERLTRVEILLSEREAGVNDMRDTLKSHEKRLNDLESHQSSVVGAKDVVTWLVMAGLALWSVLK